VTGLRAKDDLGRHHVKAERSLHQEPHGAGRRVCDRSVTTLAPPSDERAETFLAPSLVGAMGTWIKT
jgi:hypothetical protein